MRGKREKFSKAKYKKYMIKPGADTHFNSTLELFSKGSMSMSILCFRGQILLFSGVIKNQHFVSEPFGHFNYIDSESEMSSKRSLRLSVQRRHSSATMRVVGLSQGWKFCFFGSQPKIQFFGSQNA